MSILFDKESDEDGTPILYISSFADDLGVILEKFAKMYSIVFIAILGILVLAIILKTRNIANSGTEIEVLAHPVNPVDPVQVQMPTPASSVVKHEEGRKPTLDKRINENARTRIGHYYGLQSPYNHYNQEIRYYGLQFPKPPPPRTSSNQLPILKDFQRKVSTIHSRNCPQQNNYGHVPRNVSVPNSRLATFPFREYHKYPKVNDGSRSSHQGSNAQFGRYVNFGTLPTGVSQRRLSRIRSVVI